MTGTIGAIVHGVDATAPITPEQAGELRRALLDHLVIFLRDQPVDEAQQLAFATNFGPPASASVDKRPGSEPAIFVSLEDTPDSPPKADRWHTDVSFVDTPPNFAFLSMRHAPPVGGDTMWANLYAAYDALSPAMQEAINGLRVEQSLGASAETIRELYGADYYNAVVVPFVGPQHPLVRVHPETGKRALYLSGSFMKRIVGMHPAESDLLIAFLKSKLDDPNLQVRWRWQQYDMAIWDERCTNHRALADHYPHYRMIRRCLAGEEAPIPVGAR